MRCACDARTFERKISMKTLAIIGFAVGTLLAGCASTSGAAKSDPATSGAATPTHQHDHGAGDHPGMMDGMCPMKVPGTTVAATDVEGGIGLSFTTTTGDVTELRQRVRRMAEMHNNGGPKMMGSHGVSAEDESGEHQHDAQPGTGQSGGGQGSMMMGGGHMMMPAATASAEDVDGGARLDLKPKDPAQLEALREHVRMKAQRMANGECPMMSLGGGGEPASSSPRGADHDAHHPGH